MDVRSIDEVAPVVKHNVTSGKGVMMIDGEEREIGQGDLVHIRPDKVHSLRPVSPNAPIHCSCFAVGVNDAGAVDYTGH